MSWWDSNPRPAEPGGFAVFLQSTLTRTLDHPSFSPFFHASWWNYPGVTPLIDPPDFVGDELREQLAAFLLEDRVGEDITSLAVVAEDARASGTATAREAGVVAGVREALVLAELCGLEATGLVADGEAVAAGTALVEIRGAARGVLGVERTLLNVMSHMSGIATQARGAVESVAGTGARIAATRKTLPGLRDLEKRAVVLGGAEPHRRDLSAAVLIKENHLIFNESLAAAVTTARAAVGPDVRLEVEAETIEEALAGARAGADVVMLDNMDPAAVAKAIAALREAGLREGVEAECSGGITPANAKDYANAGADVISMGALTMSAPALDINFAIVATTG